MKTRWANMLQKKDWRLNFQPFGGVITDLKIGELRPVVEYSVGSHKVLIMEFEAPSMILFKCQHMLSKRPWNVFLLTWKNGLHYKCKALPVIQTSVLRLSLSCSANYKLSTRNIFRWGPESSFDLLIHLIIKRPHFPKQTNIEGIRASDFAHNNYESLESKKRLLLFSWWK